MDWRTWSPFQSQAVKDICSHMTEDEKNAVTSYGANFGVMVAVFFAIPLSVGLTSLRSSIIGLPGLALLVWLIIGVFVLIHRRRKGKELLCSTQWAKSQGITPDKV
ncbi:MAG: hypothetical protein WCS52_04460 [bacterium]